MMFVILFIVLVTGWDQFGDFFVVNMWEPLVAKFSGGAIYIISAVGLALLGFLGLIIWLSWRKRGSDTFFGKVYSIFAGLWKGFGTCLKMDHKWLFIIYTILIWTMYWLMSIFIMHSIPALSDLNLTDALFLMMAGSLGWLVPVPGGFGAFHYIVALALSSIYMLPFSDGIVFATLSHEAQAITMLVFGVFSYIYESIGWLCRRDRVPDACAKNGREE